MLHDKLAWGFLGLCAGLAAPSVALLVLLAVGLSDWSGVPQPIAKAVAFAVPAAASIGLSWMAHSYSRAAIVSGAMTLVGIAIAIKSGLLITASPSWV